MAHQCSRCDRYFVDKRALHKHQVAMRAHDGFHKARFDCDFCFYDYESQPELDAHISTTARHANKHKCEGQILEFASEQALQQHLTHSIVHVRPYECKPCGRRFVAIDDLGKHNHSVHPNKFECRHCKRLFDDQMFLGQHADGAHWRKCWTCDRQFRSSATRERHLRGAHWPFGMEAATTGHAVAKTRTSTEDLVHSYGQKMDLDGLAVGNQIANEMAKHDEGSITGLNTISTY